MKKIGLLSDTHAHYDVKYAEFFKGCDEIWHAGDIGSIELVNQLNEIAPLRAVCGNIDGGVLRTEFPQFLIFDCEDVKVFMIHIGGYPGKYQKEARQIILEHKPKIFISGHSHILKVINDPQFDLLHINPGAAGLQGFHIVRTLIRFVIDKSTIRDLEVLEINH